MVRKKLFMFVAVVIVMTLVLSVTAVDAKPVKQGIKQPVTTAPEFKQKTENDKGDQDKLQQKLQEKQETKQEVMEKNKSEETQIENKVREKKALHTYNKAESYKVKARGHIVNFGYPPVLKSDKLLIPLKAISGMLNVEVTWDEQTRTVVLTKPDDPATEEDESVTVEFNIDNPQTVKVNDSEVALDIPPEIIENRTYVPIRFFAEQLGFKVNFDETTNEVSIDDGSETPTETELINDETAPAGENVESGTETD